MAEKDAAEKQTLEEQFAQLDDIIAKLDDPKIGLEDSFKLYKEGMNVLKKCNLSIEYLDFPYVKRKSQSYVKRRNAHKNDL